MKAILIISASLMVGASVYGFMDYRQRSESKAFRELYKETKTQPLETVEAPAPTASGGERPSRPDAGVMKKQAPVKKAVKKKRKVTKEMFSRAALEKVEAPVEKKL